MKNFKRLLAMLLAAVMVLSMAACGQQKDQDSTEDPNALDREDKELIAELIGGEDASDMTDEELDSLIDQLLSDKQDQSAIVDLSNKQDKELPFVNVSDNKDAYDENGAMTKPFDQVYPELIDKELVAFSGESILIKLKSHKLTDGLKKAGIGALEEIVPLEGCAWYEAKLIEGADAKQALAAVRELKEVMLAEYNYEIQTAALDDYKHFDKDKDEAFKKNGHNKDQWHFHHCGIVDGYDEMQIDGGDSSVVVAVIDSGVDYDHQDLKDNMWINADEKPDNGVDDDGNGYIDDYYGVDMVAGKGNGDDTNGHGTHVAGIIAARNNNVGVLGIAYNVKIMSVKAAAHNGTLNQADIAKAVLYAYENGAEIINMSFGGSACSIAVQDALATAYTRCVLVASAGNSGYPNEKTDFYHALPNYPAALTYVLGVMSVDETGTESVFSNWDATAFNGAEYELYAPGENIMSTLPNDQYGYLSGTSMAAPVVSAFAAILRSEFSDRDKYPTKFIYGQLASTSENYGECCNPKMHIVGGLPHNTPQIANLYAALTKLPKPELNVQEYYLFDDPKYSDKNNGDGVIDAGETIALGLVIRNRWGMSENTLVTIDTISANSGMSDPYITIQNPTVNYGSVGTYSTQDCGKVYTDELFTGWKDPFLITISEDCPNDYRFTLNVKITCKNALDEDDETLYVFGEKPRITLDENVRAGYILPSVIEKDMVLTKDNLYIIPNATVIQEGVTVKVMPGTHIQFWSDDANDPYAGDYIAYLLVNGKFLVEGTKEEPVYIYPSQLMDRYGVEISSSSTGYVSLKYADITNFFYSDYSTANHTGTGNTINLADHCTFRNNYSGDVYVRYLYGGVVRTSTLRDGNIGHINAKDCVFYKLAFYENTYLYGTADRCIFVQCGIDYQGTYENCVFLGNSLVDQTNSDTVMTSSYSPVTTALKTLSNYVFTVYFRPDTGTTYIMCRDDGTSSLSNKEQSELLAGIQGAFGGSFAKFETLEEAQWLDEKYHISTQDGGKHVYMGIHAGENGEFLWYDGTPVDSALLANPAAKASSENPLRNGKIYNAANTSLYPRYLFEIPGTILPEEITFRKYTVDMDMASTYQVAPKNTPVQLPVNAFLYESSDESVLTVSDTGLVTPVGKGTADVWVYSLDKAVKNRVTITVKDYVALESLTFPADTAVVAAGETLAMGCALTPANTTRRNVTYTSSDKTVATVDEGGNITGISSGTVTITATCEGFTDTVTVTVYTKATSLQLGSIAVSASLADGTLELPEVIASAGAEMDLSWRSTDEAVATVEDGNLIPKSAGTTSIVVTDSRSGLSASCLVIVGEVKVPAVKDVQLDARSHMVLLDNGDLYYWTASTHLIPTLLCSDVVMFNYSNNFAFLYCSDGSFKISNWLDNGTPSVSTVTEASGNWSVAKLAGYDINNYFFLTTDGNVYAWGTSNAYGQLGLGINSVIDVPTLVNLDGIVDIASDSTTTWFLTDKGELYAAGNLSYATTATPVLIDTGVAQLQFASGSCCNYLSADGQWKCFDGIYSQSNRIRTYSVDVSALDKVAVINSGSKGVGIKDGKVYTFQSGSTALTEVPGITDAVDVYTHTGTHYIVTESGLLFGFGANSISDNDMAGITTENPVTTPVLIPILPLTEEAVTVTGTDLVEGVLVGDTLTLTFNKALNTASPKLYADGVQVTMQSAIAEHNRLIVSRAAGLTKGVSYELVFEAGSLHAVGGVTNTEEIRIAFTYTPGEASTPETDPDNTRPVIYESILDETVERILTPESLVAKLKAYNDMTQYNPSFTGNAILNPTSTDLDVNHWLRPLAPTVSAGTYSEIPLGGNWWGTTNETAISLQMIDYTDFVTYARLMYKPYLTQAPENTFPFVTSVTLWNKNGEQVTTVGNETVTFRITFNRDMDTSIPLLVRFGSAFPYGDYEIEGQYVDARTWEGTYTLNTLIENGNQYFTISNGCSATEDLPLQIDQHRFGFVIDTTAAQALIMQGTATETGIELKWTQDDFDTLMGYNVYRSTSEDGYYQRLNSTVIPADTMAWFDDTVEPGVVYYYNFTVVQSDMSESEPSGKIVIMSKDTMAPNIYHSPAGSAFTGANLVISATITDNLNIAYANLYYRVAGTETWKIVRMNKLNDKYSAIIPAADVTTAGIEYYIEAFDGVSYTCKGSAEVPFAMAVQEAVDADALGDVDGDGVITNLDALLLLYAINDKYNMTSEEFARADLNGDGELWAAEALRILQYVSGVVGSVKMS